MSYIGRGLQSGAFRQLDDISSGFDGSDTTHTMQVNSTNVTVGDVNQILLSLGGVIQKPGTDFTVSSSTLTFTTAPAANTSFFAILLGSDNGGTVTPTDLSVTTAKIAADNVTPPKTSFFNNDPGNAADLGTLHIKTADSSAATHTSADELVLENSTHCGISILSGTAATGNIYFNDSGGEYRGYFEYNHNTDKLSIGTAGANALLIDSTGAVTKPLQPAFLAYPAAQQSNLSSGTDLIFGTEVTDRNADYNASTGVFTAPVTGLYQMGFSLRLQEVPDDATYVLIQIVASNRSFYYIMDTGVFDEDGAYIEFNASYLVDMDASDTAKVTYTQSGGTTSTDMSAASYSFGFLAC